MTISLKKKYVVLIVGPSGTGKSTLASFLATKAQGAGYSSAWVNADYMRQSYLSNDLGFTPEDRVKQANRVGSMTRFALGCSNSSFVVADFICPTPETRRAFLGGLFGQQPTNQSSRSDGSLAEPMPLVFGFDPTPTSVVLLVVTLNSDSQDQFQTNFVNVNPLEFDAATKLHKHSGPPSRVLANHVFSRLTETD